MLVVDDDESHCRRVCEILSAQRFDVVTFSRPDLARSHLRNLCSASEVPVDSRSSATPSSSDSQSDSPSSTLPSHTSGIWRYAVALVDLNLPDAAGPALIRDIRHISPPTRVLAVSAFPDSAELLAAFRAGAVDVIEKPIQPDRLVHDVERQLADAGILARDETDFNRRLGARLRRVRLRCDRTIQELADAASITPAQISQIESGRSGTSTWTLARLCAALRVRLSTLCDLDGPA